MKLIVCIVFFRLLWCAVGVYRGAATGNPKAQRRIGYVGVLTVEGGSSVGMLAADSVEKFSSALIIASALKPLTSLHA